MEYSSKTQNKQRGKTQGFTERPDPDFENRVFTVCTCNTV